MGVDLAGFIFYPKSPRYVVNKIAADYLRKFRGRVAKVGVFVNTPYEELMKTVEDYRLDMVQLHGDEIPRYCEQVGNYITVVKAFRLSENDPVEWMAKPYEDACDMFMFDTLGAGYGGTGKKFDWNVLKGAAINKLFFLSGGIDPGDEEKLKEFGAKTPLGRPGQPAELASIFVQLAANDASYTTGHIYGAAGGSGQP